MKVKELIELLKEQPEDMPVAILVGEDEIAYECKSVDLIPGEDNEGVGGLPFVQIWGGDSE